MPEVDIFRKFFYHGIEISSINSNDKRISQITISIDFYTKPGSPIKEVFHVNEHITLKYRPLKTWVYIDGVKVFFCPEITDRETGDLLKVDPKVQFKIYCQWIQDWVFSGYDYRLINPSILIILPFPFLY